MRPRVKICGVTRASDAVLASDLGAAAIGFVFWRGSPRWITPDAARQIVRRLPPLVTAVGVFVNQAVRDVEVIAAAVPLGAIQLHGDEAARDFEGLARPLIKALRVHGSDRPAALADLPPWITVLLDAYDPDRAGGTGRTIDWSVAADVAEARPIILSGGLNPDNVADAIAAVRPAAVDVASGVEAAPGVKDPAKLRAFFRAVEGGSRS